MNLLNSDVFDPSSVDPQTNSFNRMMEELLAKTPSICERMPQEIREEMEAGKSWMGPINRLDEGEDRWVRDSKGDVPIRVFLPDEVKGVFLHIHGGGFVLMRPYYFDRHLVEIAKKCQVVVVSVDYRLAPENPYPAAPDDCEKVALWLARESKLEFGAEKLVIGGESAGSNLSVVTLIRMRDRHGFTGFKGASLFFGGYDFTMTPSQRNWGDRDLNLSTPIIKCLHGHYAPKEKWTDPEVSPLYADLQGLPEALIVVGSFDPLLDDSLFMHVRWLAARNRSELAVYPGGIHGFNFYPIKIAREANNRLFGFISRMVSNKS